MSGINAFWGDTVDTSGPVWRLNAVLKLNWALLRKWPPEAAAYEASLKIWTRHCVESLSAPSVAAYFKVVRMALESRDVVASMDGESAEFLFCVHKHFKTHWNDASAAGAVNVCRRFYVYCADRCVAGFNPDAATAMASIEIGSGGHSGVAVRRLDPDAGPLSTGEYLRLRTALAMAAEARILPLPQAVFCLLILYYGCNVENLLRLDRGDLFQRDGATFLRVPRIKKGGRRPREEFIEREIGEGLAELVRALEGEDPGGHVPGKPLFLAPDRDGTLRRAGHGWAYEIVRDLPRALAAAGKAGEFRVVHDDGREIRLFPRRARYSFARLHALSGADPETLALLLDHSNTSTVMVYFDPGMELVDRLDESLGERLAPLARRALYGALEPGRVSSSKPSLDRYPYACLRCNKFRAVSPEALGAVSAEVDRCSPAGHKEGARQLEVPREEDLISDLARAALVTLTGGVPRD